MRVHLLFNYKIKEIIQNTSLLLYCGDNELEGEIQ